MPLKMNTSPLFRVDIITVDECSRSGFDRETRWVNSIESSRSLNAVRYAVANTPYGGMRLIIPNFVGYVWIGIDAPVRWINALSNKPMNTRKLPILGICTQPMFDGIVMNIIAM
jgi:hypothetical protein